MNPYAPRQISVLQYIFFIHGAQVGFSVLTLPRELAEIAGTDGWISIILGWLLAVLVSLITIQTMKRYPNSTILDLLPHLFGKWGGKLITVVTLLYFFFATTTILLSIVSLLKLWLLSQTPYYLIMFLILVPVLFIVGKGVKTLARYAELIFYLSLWVPIVLILSIKEMHFLYLLPVWKAGLQPVLKAVPTTIIAFLGFEIAFFLYPYLRKKQFASVGIVIANTLSMGVFLFGTLAAYVTFSPDEITHLDFPVLSMWKVIEYRFLERLDLVFLAFYLFIISTSWMPYMYFSVFSLGKLWRQSYERGYLIALMLLLTAGTYLYTPSFTDVQKLRFGWNWAGMVFGYAVPVFLWAYTRLFDYVSQRRIP
ncbi:spore germination protein [Brevibacillus ruminantium]|uniref:Spore germination protein n=1 Tax=Brevibacillus ruminantium TaxID=2950604 RepID=A0ABY4WKY6_9BACL|nr:endospore germination permease [Brevibacillus ruminantium]USG66722.1 spore germination protein [Brevibacillus ruminantium]